MYAELSSPKMDPLVIAEQRSDGNKLQEEACHYAGDCKLEPVLQETATLDAAIAAKTPSNWRSNIAEAWRIVKAEALEHRIFNSFKREGAAFAFAAFLAIVGLFIGLSSESLPSRQAREICFFVAILLAASVVGRMVDAAVFAVFHGLSLLSTPLAFYYWFLSSFEGKYYS